MLDQGHVLVTEVKKAGWFSHQVSVVVAGTVWGFLPHGFHALITTRDRLLDAVITSCWAGPWIAFSLIALLPFPTATCSTWYFGLIFLSWRGLEIKRTLCLPFDAREWAQNTTLLHAICEWTFFSHRRWWPCLDTHCLSFRGFKISQISKVR